MQGGTICGARGGGNTGGEGMIKEIVKGVWLFLRPDGSKRAKLERCAYLFVPQRRARDYYE